MASNLTWSLLVQIPNPIIAIWGASQNWGTAWAQAVSINTLKFLSMRVYLHLFGFGSSVLFFKKEILKCLIESFSCPVLPHLKAKGLAMVHSCVLPYQPSTPVGEL